MFEEIYKCYLVSKDGKMIEMALTKLQTYRDARTNCDEITLTGLVDIRKYRWAQEIPVMSGAEKTCGYCHRKNSPEREYCFSCGAKI